MFLLQFPAINYIIVFASIFIIVAIYIHYLYEKKKRLKREQSHIPIKGVSTPPSSIPTTVESDPSDPMEALTKTTEMPIPLLKAILGIPLTAVCTATTAADAERKFRNSENGTEEEYVSLLKWIELEDDITNAYEMYECAEEYNGILEDLAVAKWNKLSLQKADKASSEEELEDAFSNSPGGSESEAKIIKKLYEVYKKR